MTCGDKRRAFAASERIVYAVVSCNDHNIDSSCLVWCVVVNFPKVWRSELTGIAIRNAGGGTQASILQARVPAALCA